jgi:hypothetical protein
MPDGTLRLMVTGGAGFIGSTLIRQLLGEDESAAVLNVDKLTYAGNLECLEAISNSPRYQFERADVCDGLAVRRLLRSYRPDAIIHLASETHVDRSIDGPGRLYSNEHHRHLYACSRPLANILQVPEPMERRTSAFCMFPRTRFTDRWGPRRTLPRNQQVLPQFPLCRRANLVGAWYAIDPTKAHEGSPLDAA